jgi:membrane protein
MFDPTMIPSLRSPLETWLWDGRWNRVGIVSSVGVRILRYLYALLRDVASGELNLRAMSLVYTTLLSIVPVMVLTFSVLRGLGVHRRMAPGLVRFLDPLGHDNAVRIAAELVAMVDKVRGGLLVGLGIVFLFYTVISMLQKIESSFNFVWQVEQSRSFARRFTEYVSMLVLGPALMVLALGLTASVSSNALVRRLSEIERFGHGLVLAGKLGPYVVVGVVFTFLYMFMPNTRVRFRPALVAGMAGGIAWAAASAFFASFIANSGFRVAIYGPFALGIVALIWLYLNWLILLIGAQLSFYVQSPEYLLTGRADIQLPNRVREALALVVMRSVATEFLHGRPGPKSDDLAPGLGIPATALSYVFEHLKDNSLLVVTEDQRLVPGRALEHIRLAEILAAVRGREVPGKAERRASVGPVQDVVDGVESAIAKELGNRSLRELLDVEDGEQEGTLRRRRG